MTPRLPKASPALRAALAAGAALAIAGCGEVKNTITPQPYSADTIKVVLPTQPNALYVGLYEAQARGFFKQSDLKVQVVQPAAGEDPITMVHDGLALAGISSEPNVLLHRNLDQPVVGVAAIVHAPLPAITVALPKAGPSGGTGVGTSTTTTTTRTRTTRRRTTRAKHPTTRTSPSTTPTRTRTTPTTTTPTTTTLSEPDTPLWPAKLQQLVAAPGAPTFDGLVVVVGKPTIVDDAQLVRRFVQALARGYRAARANPARAITDLITAVPSLAPQKALETNTLTAAIPYFFPAGLKVWGYQKPSEWNAFGTWMSQHQLLSNQNAITDASTNELLAGQGV